MASALLRMMALMALLFMPMSMGAAPALAQPAAMAAGTCDEQPQPANHSPAQVDKTHCAACAALPALEVPEAAESLPPQPAAVAALSDSLAGIEPEIATPPPKFA